MEERDSTGLWSSQVWRKKMGSCWVDYGERWEWERRCRAILCSLGFFNGGFSWEFVQHGFCRGSILASSTPWFRDFLIVVKGSSFLCHWRWLKWRDAERRGVRPGHFSSQNLKEGQDQIFSWQLDLRKHCSLWLDFSPPPFFSFASLGFLKRGTGHGSMHEKGWSPRCAWQSVGLGVWSPLTDLGLLKGLVEARGSVRKRRWEWWVMGLEFLPKWKNKEGWRDLGFRLESYTRKRDWL